MNVTFNAELGRPFFEGTSSFRNKDDVSDNKVGGVYSHVDGEFSATKAGEWLSYLLFLRQMFTAGVGAVACVNKTGSGLAKGALVTISGCDATAGLLKASAASWPASAGMPVFVLAAAIANNATGTAYAAALISGLDTSGAAAVGDPVYLGVAGAWAYTAQGPIIGRVTVKDPTTGAIAFYPGAAEIGAGAAAIAQIVTVGKSGAQFTTIAAACAYITALGDASDTKHYTILVYPGIYSEQVVLPDYVSLRGVGATSAYGSKSMPMITGDELLLTTNYRNCIQDIYFLVDGPSALGHTRTMIAAGQRALFENCTFYLNGSMAGEATIGIATTGGSYIAFKGCAFLAEFSNCPSFTFISVGSTSGVNLTGCTLGHLSQGTFFSRTVQLVGGAVDSIAGLNLVGSLGANTTLIANNLNDGTYVSQLGSAAPQPNLGTVTVASGGQVYLDPMSKGMGLTFNLAHLLVQLDGNAKLPAVDGSQITSVNAASLGGAVVGTGAGNIVALDSTPKLPAVDGSELTDVDAASLGGKVVGTSANNIVALDGMAQLPAVSGMQLTNLPAQVPAGSNSGDIMYWNGSAWTVLARGSSLQQLRMNSNGDGLEWFTP